ncbi:hypothetical protein L486_03149 [Kwoniella mangroviensis CBS 10435]|uniref:Uncharacterized protein n=1 Tax=Kwoniella mangroviensis CBS 10435 TaxID=1331196 RepID=A0A1B9ISZ4_9TREE|nr:uncharacterized protein I203_01833 [Kwoniella mangroviensis CBS 8507]OCF58659.1 hypothetical protein L486_03149 [Kwoniella mangroviensis CBS 10435]OCF68450.1 hypothetical protein I203_01833 [Kwoniella mangroviensis CBS 8507]OCF77086.1 hypothetical protein I204_02795 [Kwoniella mangroviensis CBS 8886]
MASPTTHSRTDHHVSSSPFAPHPPLTSVLSHTTSLSRNRSTRQSRPRSASSLSEDPEIPRPARPPSPPAPEANAPPPAEEVTRLRLVAHYAGLVLASILGCLIRLGLYGLGTYDGTVIYPLIWSQAVGSGIMGLSLARKNEIISIYPPIYTFLTTGIAGSVTTFASWMLDGYLAFSNFHKYDRKGLHDTVDGVIYSLSTFAIAIAFLRFGEHFSKILPSLSLFRRPSKAPLPDRLPAQTQARSSNLNSNEEDSSSPSPSSGSNADPEKTSSPSSSPLKPLSQTPLLDILWISTAFFSYLIILLLYFLAKPSWRHNVTFPLLVSPPGTIIRFYFSRFNTRPKFIDRFPLGTFIVNFSASIIISICFALQRLPLSQTQGIKCNALNSIQQGFCGCLSTVSTFVVEARTIKSPIHKWIYIGGSVILGHLMVLAIVGGIGWDYGYVDVCKG